MSDTSTQINGLGNDTFRVKKVTSSESSDSENVRRPKSSETSVAVSLRKANCTHKSVMFYSVAAQLLGGSAHGGRFEKISHS
jgi:hypothetical protein